jgi:hypothetical protein
LHPAEQFFEPTVEANSMPNHHIFLILLFVSLFQFVTQFIIFGYLQHWAIFPKVMSLSTHGGVKTGCWQ